MTESLTRLPRVREAIVRISSRPYLTQRCKRFVTVSSSTQVAVLPWRHDAKMGSWAPQTRYTLRRNTAV